MNGVKIHAWLVGEVTTVDLLIDHPMESGERRDGLGDPIPARYLVSLTLLHNDVDITTVELGPLVSRNPAMSMQLMHVNVGDKISVEWRDNGNQSGVHTSKISAP